MVTLDFHRGATAAIDAGPAVAFYRHGWHSWSPTGWVNPTLPVSPIADEGRRLGHDDPRHAFDTRVGGSGVGLLQHPDGSVTLLGALDPGARVWPDGAVLRGSTEGESVEWVTVTGEEHPVLREYASLLATRFGRRGGEKVRVWCSWYSFYEDVTETRMNEVLVGLEGMPFDIVQVDDGWERAVGDWSANAGFPGGMAAMADRIHSAGFTPGLWLAPLIAQSTSNLARERGELLLRDEAGDPVVAGINWGSPYYALDATAEATCAFLSDLIGEARGWGYRYLKLDFLYAGAFPGVHANPMPREVAYRRACEVMREQPAMTATCSHAERRSSRRSGSSMASGSAPTWPTCGRLPSSRHWGTSPAEALETRWPRRSIDSGSRTWWMWIPTSSSSAATRTSTAERLPRSEIWQRSRDSSVCQIHPAAWTKTSGSTSPPCSVRIRR